MVQRSRGDRRRPALVAHGRRRRAGGGRQRLDPPRLASSGRRRIEGFGIYGEATGGRPASTKLELPEPPAGAASTPWPLRATDLDRHGHLNNAVYWQAVEHVLVSHALDPRRPLVAELDYHAPIDFGDELELATAPDDGGLLVGFRAPGAVKAVARIQPP